MSDKHLFQMSLKPYEDLLRRAGKTLEADRKGLEKSTETAREAALAAIAAGMPERQVSRLLGVSIPTLRKWQGKK